MLKKLITYIVLSVFSLLCIEPCVLANGTEVFTANNFSEFADLTCELTDNSDSEISVMSVNDDFSLNRLIVHTDHEIDYYGAKYAIKGYDGLVVLQYSTSDETKSAYEKYLNNPLIKYVEPDILVNTSEDFSYEVLSSDYLSWGYGNDYINISSFQNQYLSDKDLPEINVAIIDTGIDSDHSMFSGRIVNGKNFINTSTYPEDDNGHGTHVSGIVCEGTPDNVLIMPIKSMNSNGSGSTLTVSNGIQYALNNGADVINMSIGGLGSYNEESLCTKRIQEAVNSGCAVIAASGNFKMNISSCTPANVPETISVSATNKSNTLATGFSNYGLDVDISAPGVSIVNANKGGATTTRSGTSMSAPHVSAAAANLLSFNPNLTPEQTELLLEYNSTPVSPKKNYPFGKGILNLSNFSFNAITFEETEIKTAVGAKISLNAKSYPSSDIAFVSSDTSIASVDDMGNVTAISDGMAEITATANGVSAKCKVTVAKVGNWYDENETDYYISSPDELNDISTLLASKTEDFSDKTITLLSDIDMSNLDFIPIGTEENRFSGTFNGNGHTISNLNNTTYLSWQGLFGVTDTNSVIKNLTLLNAKSESESSVGILAGKNYGKISNCSVSGNITAKNAVTVIAGGICAVNYGRIINCKNSSDISLKGAIVSAAGGICAKNYGEILNCINEGSITGTEYRNTSGTPISGGILYIGGITGQNGTSDHSGLIKNSVNLPTPENNAISPTQSYTGAICANFGLGEITNCYFYTSDNDAIAYISPSAKVQNVTEFDENSLKSDMAIGTYAGNDLLTVLNLYALEYNKNTQEDAMYLWSEDELVFSLLTDIFYIEDNSIISGSIYDMSGNIVAASYNSEDVCIQTQIFKPSDLKNSVTVPETTEYTKVFWWDISSMVPKFLNLKQ